ncbi:MAG: hypothetical protein AAF226_05420, partial [Verrucomicrobiota bacterium]
MKMQLPVSKGQRGLSPAPTLKPVSAGIPKAAPVDYDDPQEAVATIQQLSKIVDGFLIRYPEHTQTVPVVRPGEHPLIAFVRTMVSSMERRASQLEKAKEEAQAPATCKASTDKLTR